MSDENPSVELTPSAEFVVGELQGTVKGHEKQLNKLESNFEHLQVSIADQFEELTTAGGHREKTILTAIDENYQTTQLEWKEALKEDQDAREDAAAKRQAKKDEAISEKKKTRNKIFVIVVSSLIISGIGFCAMIAWLGFRVYLNNELEMKELKQEIRNNGK